MSSGDFEQAIGEANRLMDEAIALFRRTPDSAASDYGQWQAREVISHLLWWHVFALGSAEGVLAGREAQSPPGHRDEINAHAIVAYAATPLGQLADQLAAVHERLMATLRKLPDPSVVVMRRSLPSLMALTGHDRLRTIADHLREHMAELRPGG